MSKKKKHPKYKFKRKKIKEPENNAMEALMEIYQESDDLDEKMNKKSTSDEDTTLKALIEDRRSHHRKKILIGIIGSTVILALAAVTGFFYFDAQKTQTSDTVKLKITAPEKIKLGETFEYLIEYQNLNDADLTDSRLLLQLPHGFILKKAEPEPINKVWPIGALKIWEQGQIKLEGKIIDAQDEEQKLTAKFIFTPANFNADFSQETAHSIALEKSELELAVDYPATATLGPKIVIKAEIGNQTDTDFENVRAEFIYPEHFNFSSATPTSFEDNQKWLIPELLSRAEPKGITLEGNFPADLTFEQEADREQIFVLQLYGQGNNEQFYLIQEKKFFIQITDDPLATYLIINGTTGNKTVGLGNQLTLSAVAQNTGQKTFENLSLTAVIDSAPLDIIDWEKLQDEKLGSIQKTDQGKEITWTKSQLDELEIFEVGEELIITFTVPIKTAEQLNLNDIVDSKISGHTELTTDSEKKIKSSPVELTLTSTANINVKALYYYEDGTPLGNGPFPPRVDQETAVKIFWDLSNDLHELAEVYVTATLPDNIELTDETNVSAGQITYNSETRELKWTINRLPKTVKEAHANFNVMFTPQDKDVDKLIQLLGNTALSAKDSSTNDLIIKTKNIVTTALEQDVYAEGQGTVQP